MNSKAEQLLKILDQENKLSYKQSYELKKCISDGIDNNDVFKYFSELKVTFRGKEPYGVSCCYEIYKQENYYMASKIRLFKDDYAYKNNSVFDVKGILEFIDYYSNIDDKDAMELWKQV